MRQHATRVVRVNGLSCMAGVVYSGCVSDMMRHKVYTVLFLLVCSILVRIYFVSVTGVMDKTTTDDYHNHPRVELHQQPTTHSPNVAVQQKHITLNFQGRLGNLMFEYASLYGISRKNNLTAVVPRTLSLLNYFNLTAEMSNNVQAYSTTYVEKRGCAFEPEAMQLGNGNDVRLDGYFQSWKYFQFVEKELRHIFKWKESTFRQANDVFRNLVQYKQDSIYIGVHVRRGDMVDSAHMVNYGYISADKGYLDKALTYYRSKFKNVSFIVVSDDITWCDENIKGEDVHILRKNNSPEVDMAILTLCNHTVITSGSFGWWSAWLAGGEVVYYKGYPRPGSKLFELLVPDDYRPPSWIGM
ncbi:galactoside alpha-(1,2)-fucosyltransferase 2-like isoform X1 [Haliotis cracherodii]|uniref:galactoside alpha-(1,2)-fucosyltransferase 2-like isoform X1 n=2 Tax=Haliotis cracherodii TaxID=6455 RepID=UPI0039EBD320